MTDFEIQCINQCPCLVLADVFLSTSTCTFDPGTVLYGQAVPRIPYMNIYEPVLHLGIPSNNLNQAYPLPSSMNETEHINHYHRH